MRVHGFAGASDDLCAHFTSGEGVVAQLGRIHNAQGNRAGQAARIKEDLAAGQQAKAAKLAAAAAKSE